MSLEHILFNYRNMLRPYKAILRQLLTDWNRRTAAYHTSTYYDGLLPVQPNPRYNCAVATQRRSDIHGNG
jgi:hypothetical protein